MNDLKERIKAHPFFRDMSPEHIATLSGHAREASLGPDTILIREGEPATEFYLLESGLVALILNMEFPEPLAADRS